MENIIVWQIIGFVVCFILLFVFIAKYHNAVETEQDLADDVEELEEKVAPRQPVFQPRAALLQSAQAPAALEVADLKEQVKDLHYRLEELKASSQKHQADMTNQLARLEARMGTFEKEYANLQPTLLRVIDELERIKGGAESPAEQPEPERTGNSPVPELPEEELKF